MGYDFANFQISSLEVEIAELREVCIKEKHIDPDKDDRVNYVIKELEYQIQVFMQDLYSSYFTTKDTARECRYTFANFAHFAK